MTTLTDAIELRNHLLLQLERASLEPNELVRAKMLTVVVVGGGPTGVEISGMLADMKRDILAKDYPDLVKYGEKVNIYLIDGADQLLKPMSDKTHRYTFKAMAKLGVQVLLNKQVKDYVNDEVLFTDGRRLATQTLVWAAGVYVPSYKGVPQDSCGRGGLLI